MIDYLTRREMYDLVLAEPLAEVAAKLGVSEWQLRELCRRHRVPLPTPSYWRARQAGKTPKPAIFTTASDPAVELISLNPSTSSDVATEERLLRARKAVVAVARPTIQRKTSNPRSIEWSHVERPVTTLALTAHALRRAKPDGQVVTTRGDGVLSLRLGVVSVERAIFILDGLARGLEAKGIACTFSGKHAEAYRGPDKVPFALTEKIQFQKHQPTIEELKAEERYRRSRRANDWTPWERQYPEFDAIPSGELTLSIDTWGGDRRRKNWRDSTRAFLEAQLDSIVEEFDGWIDHKRDDRLSRERQARIWKRADENRGRAEARKKREGERDKLLDEIVEMGRKAEQLRAWIGWAADIEDPETRRMLGWASERLASIERALDPGSFGDWLRERKLFPETDPFSPLPADPDL